MRDATGGSWRVGRAIEISIIAALCTQRLNALLGPHMEVTELSELNRVGRAGLGTGRLQATFEAVVAQGAFVRLAIGLVEVNNTKGTCRQGKRI